jgi:hypothetical protein
MKIFEVKENRFGKCVYSTELINEGVEILRFTGKPMEYGETKQLGDTTTESFALQISPNYYLFLDEPARFFNHSCQPNCGLTPELQLVALRNIEKGEELTYDYSTTMLERDWKLTCHCNKPECRMVIRDFDQLPRAKQEYYLKHNVVQAFIAEKMEKNRTL